MHDIGLNLVKRVISEKENTIDLKNVIKFVKGKKPQRITDEKKYEYLKYLTIACLNGQELIYAEKEKMVIAKENLLMVMDGASSGDIYYAPYGVVGSTLARIDIINEKFSKSYIYFVIKNYCELIKSKNTGSAIPHTDKVFVGNIKIPVISKEKQEVLQVLLEKIYKNQEMNRILENTRVTLLPKLMNGEIDLDKIEI